ncbi:MAG TPA: hypothetical protein VFA33_08770 [Bryobacteraceae bacterium]|nr:hypothetical protein [Bryobacteraceae bacterium]
MFRVWPAALLVCVCFAQESNDLFHRAPPDVDQALRARITEFYQAHVDGKYRQAEKLVAEESKDFFYAANKPKYLSFEISRIDYAEDFTKAKVTVLCEMYVAIPGFAGKPLKVPTPSRWKVVDGQWYWYVDPDDLNQTPFGRMKSSIAGAGNSAALADLAKKPDLNALMGQVQVDKTEVHLRATAGSSDQVTIVNHMPGTVSLSLGGPALESVELKLDPPQLKSGAKGSLNLRFVPGKAIPAHPVTIELRVEQTNQVIPIRVICSPS